MKRYKRRGRESTWGLEPDSSGLTREEQDDLAREENRRQKPVSSQRDPIQSDRADNTASQKS
ncbi:hypothetical protein M1403_02565 [Patescibacteria group bacterium]|nr:hypothetical protein [Patescibacteria group bacterium]